jgi:hypothetical protein
MPSCNRSRPARQLRSVPTLSPELPAVEDLRTRAVLGRVRSPALASVIGALAYAVPERRI